MALTWLATFQFNGSFISDSLMIDGFIIQQSDHFEMKFIQIIVAFYHGQDSADDVSRSTFPVGIALLRGATSYYDTMTCPTLLSNKDHHPSSRNVDISYLKIKSWVNLGHTV